MSSAGCRRIDGPQNAFSHAILSFGWTFEQPLHVRTRFVRTAKQAARNNLHPQRGRVVAGPPSALSVARSASTMSPALKWARRSRFQRTWCIESIGLRRSRACKMRDGGLGVADIAAHVATRHPRIRRIRIEHKRALDQGEAALELAGELRECVSCHPERFGIVLPDVAAAGRAERPLRAGVRGRNPSQQLLELVAARREAVGGAVGRIDLDRLAQQPDRFAIFRKTRAEARHGAEIELVGAQALRRLAPRAVDLGNLQSRRDAAGDLRGHLILDREHVIDLAFEAVGPDVPSIRGIGELHDDAQALAAAPHAAAQHIANAEFGPICRTSGASAR